MSFRRRIALASAAAVAIAVVLASMLIYLLTSNQLHSQVDAQLRDRARTAGRLQRYLKPGGKHTAIAKKDSERLGRSRLRRPGARRHPHHAPRRDPRAVVEAAVRPPLSYAAPRVLHRARAARAVRSPARSGAHRTPR